MISADMSSKTGSPWFKKTPDELRYPVLQGNVKADVVVLGAGIAGIMSAWRLAELGADVLLLERNHVVTGDTGFTTAFVTRVPDTDLVKLAERHGADFAQQLVVASSQAQRYLRKTVAEQHIDCDWKDCRAFICDYGPRAKALDQEWQVFKQVDPRAHLATPDEIAAAAKPCKRAIVVEDEARFDPRAFILGLLKTPTGKHIRVHEESEATDVRVTQDHVTISTAHGSVTAKTCIVATGLPQPSFSELHGLLAPQVTYALLARYSQPPISDDIFWDLDEPFQYYRLLGDQFMLGGADTKPGSDTSTAHAKLESFLKTTFPGSTEVTARWSGSLFYSIDGVPYASAHPHYRGRIFVATGFGGNGMVMGTLAGLVLADLALGRTNPHAELLSFSRTGVNIPKPQPKPVAAATSKSEAQKSRGLVVLAKVALPLIYLAALVLPAVIFFSQRGGIGFLSMATTLKTFSVLMFPLVGLYAFTLVWAQVMLGSSMPIWRQVYPWIERFHRVEGLFVLLFAGLHPSLLLLAYGVDYFDYKFVAPEQHIFIYLGQFQLLLLMTTVATALLRKTRLMQRVWRYIHWANYVVFASAWIHSWYLGSDVRGTALRYVWLFFAGTVVISTIGRIVRGAKNRRQTNAPTPVATGRFVQAGKVQEIHPNKPRCITIEGQAIALYRVGDQVYATTNTCSHAGGPLCEGQLSGTVIQCPWHGSRFDVTTGKVVGPPANRPVRAYRTRITNGTVEIEL